MNVFRAVLLNLSDFVCCQNQIIFFSKLLFQFDLLRTKTRNMPEIPNLIVPGIVGGFQTAFIPNFLDIM